MSSATATQLWWMGITELAEAIRTRQASSVEVVEAHLRRIAAVNPSINAVVIVLGEQALQAAEAADRAVAAGGDVPPLHGVPFTIKDTMRMAMAVNALGLPAVAVPVGIGDGLPQAVQVIGPRYREDLCLDAAAVNGHRRGTITPIDPQVAGRSRVTVRTR